MTLKIVNNDGQNEVHSVRIDDGRIEIISIETGVNVPISEMEEIFPNFKTIIDSASKTSELLDGLTQTNSDYIWAHVSGKL
ncbi:hypothetical protein [Acinetobacter johnsonii]|uniref:hypothetical protein n=1 Tax=Acinetobacter johnsonii TaxID=40214 RepID=UPI001F26BA2C|nr:hypothetical protein [Acinetobacter johnsonii]UJA01000.1 hypothetical protein GBN93_08650 [Acinetobacter johnsonii]